MKNARIVVLVMAIMLFVFNSSAQATVTIDWVAVGDAGNAADTEIMTDSTTGYGSVDYLYRMSKYEVTNNQYCEFLNSVASTDTHGLYLAEGNPIYNGISRDVSIEGYVYSVVEGFDNKPVVYVDWYDSLRFTNWLHNGQPVGLQNSSTTENGAYDMSLGSSVVRQQGAEVWLPNENEWYKAAYYKGGNTNAGYWDYATQSDTCPTKELPPGGTNSANHSYSGTSPHLTDAGAYTNSVSAYGTFDQNGTLQEWVETLVDESHRGLRGGSWRKSSYYLASNYRYHPYEPPIDNSNNIGFRVAAVPEPCSLVLLSLGGLMLRRRR